MRLIRFVYKAVKIVSCLGCCNGSHVFERAQLRAHVNFFSANVEDTRWRVSDIE